MEQLEESIRTKTRFNRHFAFESYHLRAYIRKTKRFCNHLKKMVDSLDLAQIEVDEPFRSQGYCSAFLKTFESLGQSYGLNIFIECVHSKHLRSMLERKNYIREEESPGSDVCNYWKFTQTTIHATETS